MRRLVELVSLVSLVSLAALGVAGCGAKARPVAPPPTVVETGPEADVLVRTWIVDKHVMVKGSALETSDAQGFYGRTIEVTAKGFVSPWQGTCEAAARTLERRQLVEVVKELGVKASDLNVLEKFGFGDEVAEFRLQCNDRESPPPFLIYVSNNKAMTCNRGACYLLIQF